MNHSTLIEHNTWWVVSIIPLSFCAGYGDHLIGVGSSEVYAVVVVYHCTIVWMLTHRFAQLVISKLTISAARKLKTRKLIICVTQSGLAKTHVKGIPAGYAMDRL